jgi:hypothetical protein
VKRKIKPIGSVHFPGQTNLKHTKLSYSALTQATEADVFFSDDRNRSPNALSKIHWRTCEPISLRAREGNPEDRVIGVEKYSRSGALKSPFATKPTRSAQTPATEAGMFFSDDKNRSPNALSKIHWRTCEPISLRAREGNPEDRVIGVEKYSRSGALKSPFATKPICSAQTQATEAGMFFA